MNTKILWELFVKTGNINYYNLLKKIRSEDEDEKSINKDSTNITSSIINSKCTNNK